MENFCTLIVNKLLTYSDLSYTNEDIEVYVYGLVSFIYTLIPSLFLFIFALLLGQPLEMLLWMFIFLELRKYAGGVHAKTPTKCFLSSILLGLSALIICPNIPICHSLVYFTFSIVCLIILVLLAPVTKKEFTTIQIKQCKKRLFIIIFFISIVGFHFAFIQNYFLHALFSTTLLCVAQKIKK